MTKVRRFSGLGAVAAMISLLLGGAGGCSSDSDGSENCGAAVNGKVTFSSTSGQGDVYKGFTLDGSKYFVEYAHTWDGLCLERADDRNTLTCRAVMKGAAAAGLPSGATMTCEVLAAFGFQPYTAGMTRDAATPAAYDGTVPNVGMEQGARVRNSNKGLVVGSLRIEFPKVGADEASNLAYAASIVDSVALTPNFLLSAQP
jgi:hypothetical protein